jgi:branched-chain amino acid transport system ATP-binding protein
LKKEQMLRLENIIKDFGGLRVLDSLSLQVGEGSIFGLIGPNGAGKTTLFNIISGLSHPTAGRVIFNGTDITHLSPSSIAARGMGRTFQNIRIFKELSLLENVLVGMHRYYTYSPLALLLNLPIRRQEEKAMREKATDILDIFHLAGKAKRQADSLSYGEQRKLELARALATSPKLILIDEPAAGMNPAETEELIGEIIQINKRGYTICLIEHDMKFVMGVCQQVAVLNFGKLIALGPPDLIKRNPVVIEAYLGKEEPRC